MSWLTIQTALQLVVGLGLLNVWLLRSKSATSYRGGEAKTLKQEFAEYGLPEIIFWIVGALKVGSGLVLVAGVWTPLPVDVAAGIVAALMAGAVAMHIKVSDPMMKSAPAALMLAMCLAIIGL
ncbi:MAG: DoxX family protein [Gemmatimonadetes bacterium]|nr:DoxX family protein [Gemmatimonadota bacterium]